MGVKNEITIVGKSDKIENESENYCHFGFKVAKKQPSERDDNVSITLIRDKDMSYIKDLYRLEKIYKMTNNKLPLSAIIPGLLGIILLILYFAFPKVLFNFVFLIFSIIAFGVAFFFLIVYLSIILNKKKILEAIFEEGDRLSGVKKTEPLTINIEKDTEMTGILEKQFASK